MTIASELTRIQGAKSDIIDAIENKGVSVPSNALISDLDTYVSQISGSPTLVTLDDINSVIENFFSPIINARDSYPVYTQNSVTLYTPGSTYQIYAIHKRSNGKYRIGWFDSNKILVTRQDNTGIITANVAVTAGGNTANLNFLRWDGKIRIYEVSSKNFYYSPEYDTIAECITAIQSSSTTYTLFSGGCGFVIDTPYYVPYMNSVILDTTDNTFHYSQRISQDETIQTIS